MTDETPKPKSLAAAEFTTRDATVQEWCTKPSVGTKREDILRPEYWKHIAWQVKPPAFIDVFPIEGNWYARLRVLYADRFRLIVKEVQFDQDETEVSALAENREYVAEFISAAAKFGVKRVSDKQIMKYGLGSLEEARQWMADYLARRKAA